ncbi:MAG TPA: dehydrogenase, partial [Verrucomicrobiales bacterium]|nr:dehydrogenase [Verrucomicrobiales bacterium]
MKSCFFRPLFSLPFALGLSFAALPGLLQAQKGDRPGHVMKPPPAHWKIPEAPVVPAEKALATLAVAPGFVVNAYATEPMVEDPVAIAFDSDGRMWVAEMIGYMPDIDGKGEDAPVGRISVLEDRDGDGVAEHRTIFLDKLVLPRAVALADADGSLLWADHEQLFVTAIEESAGGPRPGKTEVIDPHYVKGGNPEHQANGMLFNLDNWYYNAKHDLRYRKVDGKWVSSPSEVRGQWGITQDDWGVICTNSNSNLISAETYQPGISLANPRHKFTTPLTTSTKDQRLWPSRINPGVNRGYMAETLDENGFL